MKKLLLGFLLLIYAVSGIFAETQSNGSITMTSNGDDILAIMIHESKKILIYQVNQRNCALKAVRTWHYDAQFAYGIKTDYHSGVYPRETLVDSQANPLRLRIWMTKQGYAFDPNYSVKGLGRSGGSGLGGDLVVNFELTKTNGLLVILDAENYALLIYQINAREIKFCVCRSILAEIQIPFYYPGRIAEPTPLRVREMLKALEKEINKKNPTIPFVMKEVKELGAIPGNN